MKTYKMFVDQFDIYKTIEAPNYDTALNRAYVLAESLGCGFSGVTLHEVQKVADK